MDIKYGDILQEVLHKGITNAKMKKGIQQIIKAPVMIANVFAAFLSFRLSISLRLGKLLLAKSSKGLMERTSGRGRSPVSPPPPLLRAAPLEDLSGDPDTLMKVVVSLATLVRLAAA